MDRLDLGCGNSKPNGFMGLNNVETEDTDVVHDLESGELPFDDNSFDVVRASHVLEHLSQDSFEEIVCEVARVLRTGGVFKVIGPHFLSWNSPAGDHYRGFSRRSFDCFSSEHDFVTSMPQKFTVESIEYEFFERLIVDFSRFLFGDRFTAAFLANSVNEISFLLVRD